VRKIADRWEFDRSETMALVRKLVVGTAALSALGLAGAVVADNLHTLHVTLPGGGTETITYVGDTPPKVSFVRTAETPATLAEMSDPFAADPAFAQMDRMAAAMDARAAAMMRAAASQPGLSRTSFGALPPGVTGYSVVSTYSGGKSCVRTTRYVAGENGAPAKILTSASQDCGDTAAPASRGPAPVATAPAPRQEAAPVTPVRWEGSQPSAQIRD
jgi:hypothetical protein